MFYSDIIIDCIMFIFTIIFIGLLFHMMYIIIASILKNYLSISDLKDLHKPKKIK